MSVFTPAARKMIAAMYEKAGTQVEYSAVKLYSTQELAFEVVDADTTNGTAFAVLRSNQRLDWFSYGLAGGTVSLGGTEIKASDAETNLQKPNETNGNADVSVEAVSLHVGPPRVAYDSVGVITNDWGKVPVDPDVVKAITGSVQIVDPGSLVTPPQVGSVFNLGQQLLQALPLLSVQIKRDGDMIDRLGTADLIPGVGPTMAATNGAPEANNRMALGDGFAWLNNARGSELLVQGRTERALVIPIQFGTWAGGATKECPSMIYLPLKFVLHGYEFRTPRGI